MAAQTFENDTQKLERCDRGHSMLNPIALAIKCKVDLTRALNAALAQVPDWFELPAGFGFRAMRRSRRTSPPVRIFPPL
jgi:hypothetical protein